MPFRLKPEISVSPCLTCLAKMRRNTITYWRDADFANRKTYSFIRLNDAFGKTLLKAARKESRKLTNHLKQLLSRALISNVIVFYDKGGGGGGGVYKKQNYKHMFFYLLQLVRGSLYWNSNETVAKKNSWRYLFGNPDRYIYIYINISSRTYENCARCQL